MSETEEVKQEPRDVTPPPVAKSISLREGALAPRDASELSRTIKQIANGGGFPERFDTDAKRMAAYNLGNSLMRDQWQLALNHIAIIKGQMSIYGEMPGTLAERTGEVQEKEVYLIDQDYKKISLENKNLNSKPFAAVCIIQRKNRQKKEFTYTLDQAVKAGQYPPRKRDGSPAPDSPWEKHLNTMLMRKAMALAIKFEFPDALVGVPIAEYDFDLAPDLKDVTPSKGDNESSLNATFSNSSFSQVSAVEGGEQTQQ